MRDSMVFYASWLDAIKNLPREMQGEVLTAIIEYGLYGETTASLKPITKAMLALVKSQIDINNKRYENSLKGGRQRKSEDITADGDMDGEPNVNQTETKPEPNVNQTETKPEPNVNQTETKPEPNNDNDNDIYKENSNTPNVVLESKKAAKAATLSRKEDFRRSLEPYVGQYGEGMIRDFFDYWSEMNKSKGRMRFEQQPTWETPRRLASWAKKETAYGNRNDRQAGTAEQERYAESARLISRMLAEDGGGGQAVRHEGGPDGGVQP